MAANDYLVKHAIEVLDYPFDWSSVLQAGEAITSATTSIDPVEAGGLTIDSGGTVVVSNVVTPILSGGIAGRRYVVRSTILTDQGRADVQERTIVIV